MANRTMSPEWDALARALCFKDERTMYEALYIQEGLSVKEIADRLNAGTATINRRIAMHGIAKRSRGGRHGTAVKRFKLFHMDQRVVLALRNPVLSEMLDVSHTVVYHYKNWKYGNDVLAASRNEKGITNPDKIERGGA